MIRYVLCTMLYYEYLGLHVYDMSAAACEKMQLYCELFCSMFCCILVQASGTCKHKHVHIGHVSHYLCFFNSLIYLPGNFEG